MDIGIGKIKVDKFNFENTSNLKIKEKDIKQDGSLSLGLPDEINEHDDKIIVSAQLNIDIQEKDFKIACTIEGFFEVPNLDFESQDNEKSRELVKEITPLLLNKFKLFFGMFSGEVHNYISIPEMKFEF